MEPEMQALYHYMRSEILPRPFAVTLDCHSGFGLHDRIWIPYAGSQTPIADLAVAYRLYRLFSGCYFNHSFYIFEPQTHSYMTHGDLWDLLYDEGQQRSGTTYLPLTLEMGSWLWVKKNPMQLFNYVSLFNPVVPHRHIRILRRHHALLEFLQAATRSYRAWLPTQQQQQSDIELALQYWYGNNEKT